MKKTTTVSTAAAEREKLSAEQLAALKQELGEKLRARREQAPEGERLTQMALSRKMGYEYSIVTNFENATRTMLEKHLRQWGQGLGVADQEVDALLAAYRPVIMDDTHSAPNLGSRLNQGISSRVKQLRLQRNMTGKEMSMHIGMSYSHYFRSEKGDAAFTVQQLQLIQKRCGVSYDYLLDGTPDELSYAQLKKENERLQREVDLLEELRRVTAAHR